MPCHFKVDRHANGKLLIGDEIGSVSPIDIVASDVVGHNDGVISI